ncbi:myeloid cell nuclear differentiation antigen-like protein isoform X1 [Mus musculus]|uniref:Myeloid cell nuclear differentiation antigen-like protein n=1 Tax=Mus musculus TaxID=10090 RepID=MNDAL_MOUSE|nr:myeloid cell nuclear differentiation antigen-like protein isoform 1 [Mus musculus]NP_001387250.1 myeloid cell nuclear differentiation antigen-like protein isoform 1 [Mus musculus]NP_001387251.1 myeloid cell nuclear differentiation antigen-like protein isoform 1 [Mus musculus]XP_036021529.1 myeloid cell nuclear differentiation antigen-like protein isoform X1 [Mus musculus]XP_036021571.1 myeloid cell nuclear differentiation antigen-like protein isoform X1 [Mus musculus]XP_036021612.1 myeloid |eukprot:NP_001164324.1 myeloid cell nuclear differentiation antigen-like protein [Mus musculus]
MAEYKKIVLLKGLESMEDYQFRTVKSLLRKELKLTKKLQEDYDRIQLADWMEDKFPKYAGLDKLIKVCEHIKDLKDLAKKLKTEKAKVQKKKQGKCKTAVKKKGQDELSSSESLFINKESYKSVPSSKKKGKAIAKTEGEKKNKLTQDQDHLPETSGTDIKTEEDCLQNSPKPPPTSPSSSSNKKKRKEITKTEGGKKKKLTQEQAQLPEPLGTDIKKDEDCLQTPPKPPPTPPSSSLNKKRKSRREEETGVKKSKAAKEPDQPPCCEEPTARCQSPILHSSSSASSNIPSATNQKPQPQNQNIPRGAVLHSEPLTVMVLTATDPFEYESPEHEVKNMFHATVATVSQYFHVKVFNINLKEKFTKKNFIIISNYFESKGILEINETSSVLKADPDQMIEVPNNIIRNANASPKICDIQKGTSGAVFYGVFTLHKKKVKTQNTSYEIKDGSGSIEVEGSGQWHNINCKEGDKLHLFCFHLKRERGQPKLVCGDHSFVKIKVTKAGKKKEASTVLSSTKNEEENNYPKDGIKVEMPDYHV